MTCCQLQPTGLEWYLVRCNHQCISPSCRHFSWSQWFYWLRFLRPLQPEGVRPVSGRPEIASFVELKSLTSTVRAVSFFQHESQFKHLWKTLKEDQLIFNLSFSKTDFFESNHDRNTLFILFCWEFKGLVKVKDQIQFANISKVSIQDFNKEMDQLKNAQLVVIHVHLNSTSLAAGRPKQERTCENCEKI